MPLSDEERAEIDAFLDYVTDFSDSDDRYGSAVRIERKDESLFATRFEVGPSAWIEVSVWPAAKEVRIGFVTDEPGGGDEIVEAVEAGDATLTEALTVSIQDAGLEWAEPPIEQGSDSDEEFRISTALEFEELTDLDVGFLDIRDKTIRLLEAYHNVFAATFLPEGEDEFDEYDEDEDDD